MSSPLNKRKAPENFLATLLVSFTSVIVIKMIL